MTKANRQRNQELKNYIAHTAKFLKEYPPQKGENLIFTFLRERIDHDFRLAKLTYLAEKYMRDYP